MEKETVTPTIETDNVLGEIGLIQEALKMELDTILVYKGFLQNIENSKIRAIFEDAIAEEQKHVGQFEAALAELSPSQEENIALGREEANSIDNVSEDFGEEHIGEPEHDDEFINPAEDENDEDEYEGDKND